MSIKVFYINESGTKIEFIANDWDAVRSFASGLVDAPIDLDYIYYEEASGQGVFNLNTFCKQ